MYRALAVILIGLAGRAEIIDRAVMTVGRQVVTELELEEEIRVTAFFNQASPSDNIEQRQAAADRLVQQLLVAREMLLSHYPGPSETDIQSAFARIRNLYKNQGDFEAALARCSLDTDVVKSHLAQQIATLHFIEYRFRPELGISEADLQNRYNRTLAAWKTDHPGVPSPSFDVSRESIRSALIAERTDESLDNWLKETRKQIRVTYLEKNLHHAEASRS
ncbi:MAG: hypothetical protein M3Y57_21835 [Acidobacteriota bacterium]|nr:hypothetical protein [Acidobacteriota bacterium]